MQTFIKDDKFIIELNKNEFDENILNLLSYLSIGKKSKANDNDIHQLSEEILDDWWKENKKKFINENNS